MIARDLMTSPVITVAADATVGEAARLMLERNISALPVLNDRDRLVGIMSHSDFFLLPIHDPGMRGTVFELFGKVVNAGNIDHLTGLLATMRVSEVMSSPVTTITENANIEDVVRIMHQRRLKRIPVVRGDTLVGIITRHDFLRLTGTFGER